MLVALEEFDIVVGLMNDIHKPTLKALNEVLKRFFIPAEPKAERIRPSPEKVRTRALKILTIINRCRSLHQLTVGNDEQKLGRVKQYLRDTASDESQKGATTEFQMVSGKRKMRRTNAKVLGSRQNRRHRVREQCLDYEGMIDP